MSTPPRANTIQTMFEYIVEDPFWSPQFGRTVTVTDHEVVVSESGAVLANVTDENIPTLYEEWLSKYS